MVNCLIVEDDFISRCIIKKLISICLQCNCDIAVNGEEAISLFSQAHEDKQPYDLICMDIMMPGIDGREAVRHIRKMEQALGIAPHLEAKIIMTTALDDPRSVFQAYYHGGASSYLVKPVSMQSLKTELRKLGLHS